MNYNVRLTLVFSALDSFGTGMWKGNIMSLYIVILAEKSTSIFGWTPNEILGMITGISGVTMTLSTFPAGMLIDHFRRDRMLKIAAIVGIAALTMICVSPNILYISVAFLLWGLFLGISTPAVETIFADSVESGKRSGIYAKQFMIKWFGIAGGPIVNIILFLLLGDIWELDILKTVMMVGIVISMFSLFVLLYFSDDKTIGKESDSLYDMQKDLEIAESQKNSAVAMKIAVVLVGSNFIIGIGAGMTYHFFPVFFVAIYDLKPIAVQLLISITAILTGLASLVVQKYSLKRGPIETIFIVQFLATLCLITIAFYPPIWLLWLLFPARGFLMNANTPLTKSILMDAIPKKNRGKWNSLLTISISFFWNLSAVLGGFLIGNNNFKLCFLTTSSIYIIGILPILYLIPLVDKEKSY